MAGERLYDDPVWVDVSAFLADLEATYPPNPEVRGREAHLAAIAQETRRVRTRATARTPLHRPARRSQLRLVAAWVIATLLAATAAVGIAGANGRGPLARVWHPSPVDTVPVPSARPAPGAAGQSPATGGGAKPGSPVGRADHRPPPVPRLPEVDSVRPGIVDELRPPGRARGVAGEEPVADKPGKGLPGGPGNDPTRSAGRPDKPGKAADRSDKPGKAADRSEKPGKGRPGTPGTQGPPDRSARQG